MQTNKQHNIFYRDLIDDNLWNRLVRRMITEYQISQEEANKILDDTLALLSLCAKFPDKRFSPSSKVDLGVHTFVLFTKDYQQFCQRIAGFFIHHFPLDEDTDSDKRIKMVKDTINFMNKLGIPYHKELWNERDGAWCSTGKE